MHFKSLLKSRQEKYCLQTLRQFHRNQTIKTFWDFWPLYHFPNHLNNILACLFGLLQPHFLKLLTNHVHMEDDNLIKQYVTIMTVIWPYKCIVSIIDTQDTFSDRATIFIRFTQDVAVYRRLLLPTIWWQLGQMWIASLQPSMQNGMKQQPRSHLAIQNTLSDTYISSFKTSMYKESEHVLNDTLALLTRITFSQKTLCLDITNTHPMQHIRIQSNHVRPPAS